MMSTIASFVLFQVLFVLVGLSSSLVKRANKEDYLLAGRSVHPVLMALAASSTNSSGFMFIGLIGETYRVGLSSMWLMFGWIVGDYLAWLAIHRRLRARSAEVHAQSVPAFLAASPQGSLTAVRVTAALLTLSFLGTYASGQFTAGSKALESLFGWPAATGAVIGAVMVAMYCFSGGIRASIWTNSAQAIVMIGSMLLLLGIGLSHAGGLTGLWSQLRAIDPALVEWQPRDLKVPFGWFVFSWIMAGVGVIGQPHLMVIAMSISSADEIRRARPVYFIWYVVFSAACILVGLCCRVLLEIPSGGEFDAELALPLLSQQLLPGVLVGLILAGLFAATLSTADTQILCCSAAISQDLFPAWGRTYHSTKLITLGVIAGVLAFTSFGPRSVFVLLTLAWSSLAAGLGPLLAVQSFGLPVNNKVGVATILGGLAAALFWRFGLKLHDSLYEVLPGMAAGGASYGAAGLLGLAAAPDTIVTPDE